MAEMLRSSSLEIKNEDLNQYKQELQETEDEINMQRMRAVYSFHSYKNLILTVHQQKQDIQTLMEEVRKERDKREALEERVSQLEVGFSNNDKKRR